MNSDINITNRELNILIIMTFRYAINRETFCVDETVRLLKKYWEYIDISFKEQIKRDINHQMRYIKYDSNKLLWEEILGLNYDK